MSSAGQTGPESRYAGFASIFSVQGGLGTLTGYPDAAPAALGDSIDLRVGAALAFGILAALYDRRQTGRGRLVDISAREVVSNSLGAQIADFSMNGRVAERSGNRLDGALVHDLYRCAGDDAWVSIAIFEEADLAALCEVIGRPDLSGSPDNAEVDAAIEAWAAARAPEDAARVLQESGVAAMPYRSARHVAADPHLAARGTFVNVPQEDLGEQPVMRPPWRFEGASLPPLAPAVPLGHHNGFIIEHLLGEGEESQA